MTNKENAIEIQKADVCVVWNDGCPNVREAALKMAKWKDEQMYLLIDAIDHAYLKTDGTYGELSYEVSDKVKYLKNQIKDR